MSERPSKGFGKRLAKYRRIAGMSAQQLSDKLGGEMSRGVIANIESGRKTDITIDQLIALAWALGIPPVALALPIDRPYKFVNVYKTDTAASSTRAIELMDWFLDRPSPYARFQEKADGVGTPRFVARTVIRRLLEWRSLRGDETRDRRSVAEGRIEQVVLDRTLETLAGVESELQDLGVDLTVYKIDE